jgi:toxin ParE1/3/4
MRADLLWNPQAREDLVEIYLAIGIDNLDAAERLYTAMESKVNLLVNHPRLGVRRSEIQRSARILIEGAYLILYETHPDTDDGPIESAEIVRVVDGRRDLGRLF